MMVFEQMRTVVTRVRAEYCEMPGLSLTPAQAARLFGLEHAVAAGVLGGLLQSGFLSCTKTARFVRAGTGTERRLTVQPDDEGTAGEPSDRASGGRKDPLESAS